MLRDQQRDQQDSKAARPQPRTPRALLLHLSRLLRPYPAAQALLRKATQAN